jgi:signal transduction histidine kinase
MSFFRQYISRIPYWAYLLVLVAVMENTVFIFNRSRMPQGDADNRNENGYIIFDNVKPGGTSEKAGLKNGDTVISVNSVPVMDWIQGYRDQKAGDTLRVVVLRNNANLTIPLVAGSVLSNAPVYFWTVYIFLLLIGFGSLYVLYRRPGETAVNLFFISIQLFLVTANAQVLNFRETSAIIAAIVFHFAASFIGPVLVHFHLLFPKPSKLLVKFRRLPWIIYAIGLIIALGFSYSYFYNMTHGMKYESIWNIFARINLWWLAITYCLAMATAIYQYNVIKDTLSRNQLRMVIIGASFGCIVPLVYCFFYDWVLQIGGKYNHLIPLTHSTCMIIMSVCFLIAIFRYRIWDIEIVIRKALLYLGATLVITSTYLLLLYLVDQLMISETDISRFVILGISVIVFLALRDWLQRLIDRVFHRETYDSAAVVSGFEEKLAGVYKDEELKPGIGRSLDEIFHFKSLMLNLRKHGQVYEPAFILAGDKQAIADEFEVGSEFDQMLRKSKVFSPGELEKNLPVVETIKGELIIPLLKEDHPFGFLVCGPKQSEKTYSMQDIRVLSLIAKRVIALFHTASLYQKDLDRQLMLERERARISQDMHDDVGASLTRISILSELAKNNNATAGETKQWLGQISDTSRSVMEEMSQIIWALNPKNDTLEGLISYLRRFAFEYLEPTPVTCNFELPEVITDIALSVEVRRNVYLVVREALHNVVKHSGAADVWISMQPDGSRFIIRVKDNGHGFDPDNLKYQGNGLNNMRKRILDIGGEFMIHTSKDSGTEIELEVNLKE